MKASSLLPDGSYVRKVNTLAPCDSQEVFMETSIHREASGQEQPEPRRRWWSGLMDLLRRRK